MDSILSLVRIIFHFTKRQRIYMSWDSLGDEVSNESGDEIFGVHNIDVENIIWAFTVYKIFWGMQRCEA